MIRHFGCFYPASVAGRVLVVESVGFQEWDGFHLRKVAVARKRGLQLHLPHVRDEPPEPDEPGFGAGLQHTDRRGIVVDLGERPLVQQLLGPRFLKMCPQTGGGRRGFLW